MIPSRFTNQLEIRAMLIAAKFARSIGEPAGSLWEAGITRAIVREVVALGGDEEACTHVEETFKTRLGL